MRRPKPNPMPRTAARTLPGVGRDPVALGPLLADLMRGLRPVAAADPGARLADLNRLWTQVVGAEVARGTRVSRCRGGVMTVEVATSPLLAELRGIGRESLLESLEAAGLDGIHEVRFRAGTVRA